MDRLVRCRVRPAAGARFSGNARLWNVLKTAGNDWLRHSDARLGAPLAYYSVFSLGPLLLIVVSVAGLFFWPSAMKRPRVR